MYTDAVQDKFHAVSSANNLQDFISCFAVVIRLVCQICQIAAYQWTLCCDIQVYSCDPFIFQMLPKAKLKIKKLHSCLYSNILLEWKAYLSYYVLGHESAIMMVLGHFYTAKGMPCHGVYC